MDVREHFIKLNHVSFVGNVTQEQLYLNVPFTRSGVCNDCKEAWVAS